MKTGDTVLVHPHGSPEQATVGKIVVISANQRSIAVAFEHLPPFAFETAPVIGIHLEHGFMFLACREEAGPWRELAGGGHYEIEVSQ